jgi:hypothetical protein
MHEMLNNKKEEILLYLSDGKINNFTKDDTIDITEKWNDILDYPDSLHKLKGKKDISVKTIVDDYIKPIFIINNQTRVIHPILLILFHDILTNDKFIKFTFDDDFVLITSKMYHETEVREQTQHTFNIYWKLINDSKLYDFFDYYIFDSKNKIMREIRDSLCYKVTVEKLISTTKLFADMKNKRYNDLCFSLDVDEKIKKEYIRNKLYKLYDDDTATYKYSQLKEKEKNMSSKEKEFQNLILLEINESHHEKDKDFRRKVNIYYDTGRIINEYYLITDKIEVIYQKLIKEIAKIIYQNYDQDIGFLFYLNLVENIDLEDAEFFYDIYINKEATLSKILEYFNSWEFNDRNKFLKKIKKELCVKNNEKFNPTLYFKEFNEENFEDSILNYVGITKLMFIPQIDDFLYFKNIHEIVSLYTKFNEGFFNSITNFLASDEESNIHRYLYHHERDKKLDNLGVNFLFSSLKFFLDEGFADVIKDPKNKVHHIELNKKVPILMKSKWNNDFVNYNNLLSYGDSLEETVEKSFSNTAPSQYRLENHKIVDSSIIKLLEQFQKNKIEELNNIKEELQQYKLKEAEKKNRKIRKLNL